MKNVLVNAVLERQVMRINYAPGWRTVEPHTIGYGSEGQILLRAYQTEGASASGEPVNWKLFRLDQLDSVEQANMTFLEARPGYRRGDSVMKGGIIAQL